MVHFKVVVKNVKIDFYLVEHTLLVHLFKFKKLQLDILFSFQVCKSVYPLYSVTIQCNRKQMCHFCSILEFFYLPEAYSQGSVIIWWLDCWAHLTTKKTFFDFFPKKALEKSLKMVSQCMFTTWYCVLREFFSTSSPWISIVLQNKVSKQLETKSLP